MQNIAQHAHATYPCAFHILVHVRQCTCTTKTCARWRASKRPREPTSCAVLPTLGAREVRPRGSGRVVCLVSRSEPGIECERLGLCQTVHQPRVPLAQLRPSRTRGGGGKGLNSIGPLPARHDTGPAPELGRRDFLLESETWRLEDPHAVELCCSMLRLQLVMPALV